MAVVKCTILLPEHGVELAGKRVQVLVEEVSVADRAAPILSRASSPVAQLPRQGRKLGPLVFEAPLEDARAVYNLRARILSGDTVASGDLVSTIAYRLPSGVDVVDAEIAVRAI